MQNYPTHAQADALLAWASEQNPGPWVRHSQTVGRAAETIAGACGLDTEIAYTLGLLHDVGRYEGMSELHHIIAGHSLLLQKGYEHNARICLTHSFPLQQFGAFNGKTDDSTAEEIALVKTTLATVEYDDYDRLIQLCDALCLAEGVTLLQVRLLDVARRHGFTAYTLPKWDAVFGLKEHFDALCGHSVYDLFYEEILKTSIR